MLLWDPRFLQQFGLISILIHFLIFCLTSFQKMAGTSSLPHYERIPIKAMSQRVTDIIILFLQLSLLLYRLFFFTNNNSFTWLLAFLCELWFTVDWILLLFTKWTPVDYKTYPENLLQQVSELPAVDIFVTTADPGLEPPILTMNTVISLLAVDYPANKLACYLSDDGCSPLTYYSLVEASKFAKIWVPFCKKYNIQIRAPFRYFSSKEPRTEVYDEPLGFQQEWMKLKEEYGQLCQRIEDATQKLVLSGHFTDYVDFKDTERSNHPSIIKVIWENKESHSNGLPHLIYISREKRSKSSHHYKAGALNALTRISGVMTNAPFILNVDCDMYANNPQLVLHAMCLLLATQDKDLYAFAQYPQRFYDELQHDPFGNQLATLTEIVGRGFAGMQGIFYAGTGCLLRRKTVYGLSTDSTEFKDGVAKNALGEQFGDCKEFVESVAETLSSAEENMSSSHDLWNSMDAANTISGCDYEHNTNWGVNIGWLYGSTTEDCLTGMKIHARGWKTGLCTPHPPAFLGCSPPNGPISLTQKKRWATGLLEILFSKHSPILLTITTKLWFRQCLGYTWLFMWPLGSIPQLCYTILPAYAIVSNTMFSPTIHEAAIVVPIVLFLISKLQEVVIYLQCGLSIRAWWNNVRMGKITYLSAVLFGAIGAILKFLGISETVFEVTQKGQSASDDSGDNKNGADIGRFTFDNSPMFLLPTTILLVQLTALVMSCLGLQPPAYGGQGSGLGEVLCSTWQVLCLWPFVKGLFGQGKYGIPFFTICMSTALALLFVHFSIRASMA